MLIQLEKECYKLLILNSCTSYNDDDRNKITVC